MLLDRGADMHAMDAEGRMALHLAAHDGYEGIVALLLSRGESVDVRDRLGRTALHHAAFRNRRSIAFLLIKNGASVNARDKEEDAFNATPLHYAAQQGAGSVGTLLIDRCADVNARGKAGKTPLHLASVLGQQKAVLMLLAGGANSALVDSDGRNARDLAEWNGDKAMVHLIDRHAAVFAEIVAARPQKVCPRGV
jgi:ankyrin repeat protein